MPLPGPAPIYVESFRIDVGRNGMALITFGSPLVEGPDGGAAALVPTVRIAMTEDNLTELARLLGKRLKAGQVLKLRGGGESGQPAV